MKSSNIVPARLLFVFALVSTSMAASISAVSDAVTDRPVPAETSCARFASSSQPALVA